MAYRGSSPHESIKTAQLSGWYQLVYPRRSGVIIWTDGCASREACIDASVLLNCLPTEVKVIPLNDKLFPTLPRKRRRHAKKKAARSS